VAEPVYTTIAALRTELDVDSTVLPDDRALSLIEDAEDAIDSLLGGATSDPDPSGRKVDAADVDDWQFAKLGRATLKLAAAGYRQPDLLAGRQWQSVSGPDFSFSGPIGTQVSGQVLTLLNDSGLRRLSGRAHVGLGGNRALAAEFFKVSPHWEV
jgi:hypothetical protein